MKKILIALVIVGVISAGIGIWYFVIKDESLKVSSENIDIKSSTKVIKEQSSPDGTWAIQQQSDVFAGYEIEELFGGDTIKKTASAKSKEVSGSFTINENQLSSILITVDTTKLQSDDSRRDNRMKNEGLETDTFEEATFTSDDQLDLGAISKNEEISVNVNGQLKLHGQVKDVVFPVKATWNGKVITLSGEISITLSDYKISPPDSDFVKVDDTGKIKLQLLFVPQT